MGTWLNQINKHHISRVSPFQVQRRHAKAMHELDF